MSFVLLSKCKSNTSFTNVTMNPSKLFCHYFVFVLCLVCSMSLVFLDFSFMIAPSDFSNDYLFFSQWFVFVFIYVYACVCVLKENSYLNVISERKYTTGITCWAETGYTSCAPGLPRIWTCLSGVGVDYAVQLQVVMILVPCCDVHCISASKRCSIRLASNSFVRCACIMYAIYIYWCRLCSCRLRNRLSGVRVHEFSF